MKPRYFKTVITLLFAGLLFIGNSAALNIHQQITSGTYTKATLEEDKASLLKTMKQDKPVRMVIETNIGELVENRRITDYMDAKVTFSTENGSEWSFEGGVKPRGKFRRMRCEFPPLKIKLPKEGLEDAGLASFNKFKLVTHCMEDTKVSREILAKEYLAYKMYNELTDYSYRVQMVEVDYVDQVSGATEHQYGFLIENTKELAGRLGGEMCDCLNIKPQDMDAYLGSVHDMFQFMISNMDWSIPMLRNVKLFQHQNNDTYIPIPYDFDFSGLVNAEYAIPNPDLDITHVTQRVYMGPKRDAEVVNLTRELFLSKRSRMTQIIESADMLSTKSKKQAAKFLDGFYKVLEDDKKVKKQFVCRQQQYTPKGERCVKVVQ